MKIRYRWSGWDDAHLPMHGDYLMSARGRGGYLITGVDNRGPRGGLGTEAHTLLVLTVERASREECQRGGNRVHELVWDRRGKRAPRQLADYARSMEQK